MFFMCKINLYQLAQRWFLKNGIELNPWSSYSPNLYPIKNLWQKLKVDISKSKPNTIADLGKTQQYIK